MSIDSKIEKIVKICDYTKAGADIASFWMNEEQIKAARAEKLKINKKIQRITITYICLWFIMVAYTVLVFIGILDFDKQLVLGKVENIGKMIMDKMQIFLNYINGVL